MSRVFQLSVLGGATQGILRPGPKRFWPRRSIPTKDGPRTGTRRVRAGSGGNRLAILVDTSALYALIDASEPAHGAVAAAVRQAREALLLPITVVPETDYLVASRLGVRVELAMLRAVVSGELRLEAVTAADVARCVEIVDEHADSDIGFVDASLVALAERLGVTRVLTLDHRHFRMVRPRHCPAFELVP